LDLTDIYAQFRIAYVICRPFDKKETLCKADIRYLPVKESKTRFCASEYFFLELLMQLFFPLYEIYTFFGVTTRSSPVAENDPVKVFV
jgi:hypothetical protein